MSENLETEVHSIFANADGLSHLSDHECHQMGKTVIDAVTALDDEELERLTHMLIYTNLNDIIRRELYLTVASSGKPLKEVASHFIKLLGSEHECIEHAQEIVREMLANDEKSET